MFEELGVGVRDVHSEVDVVVGVLEGVGEFEGVVAAVPATTH